MNGAGQSDGTTSDEVLLAAFADGSPTAAQEIVQRHGPVVFRLSLRMLGSHAEAEEVTQEVMLRLWKVAPNWESGRARVSTWLWRVTVNLCNDVLRKAKGTGLDSIVEPADDSAVPTDRIMDNQRFRALYGCLETLPERQRSAIVLRHIEEKSNPEIAEILDTSVEAVESLLARGMRSLRQQLASRQAELGWNI